MKMRFTCAGDMLIQRRIPAGYEGFETVRDHICKGDARLFNLETTLHNGEYWGNQFFGGSFLRADPRVLEDARAYGFNMLNCANNHSMDFDRGGLMSTLNYVREAGFVTAGTGANLDEAAAPGYLDLPHGRVAMIGVTMTNKQPAAMAGRQSRRLPGRPGVNGLRTVERVQVTPEQMAVIRQIADQSKINAQVEIEKAEGYHAGRPTDIVSLKDLFFVEGPETKHVTHPNQEDMDRIKKAIYEAQMASDYILVSIHSHDLAGTSKEFPALHLQEFARQCIDAGAHAVIGHGPHLLRPVEIYKDRPIFYSLGDFVLHNECIPYAPEEAYALQKLTSDATMRELFYDRTAGYTRGLIRDHRMVEAVVPYFEMEDGKLTYLELLPVELNYDQPTWRAGNPRFSKDHGIIERLAEMSRDFGTEITVDDRGYGIVKL